MSLRFKLIISIISIYCGFLVFLLVSNFGQISLIKESFEEQCEFLEKYFHSTLQMRYNFIKLTTPIYRDQAFQLLHLYERLVPELSLSSLAALRLPSYFQLPNPELYCSQPPPNYLSVSDTGNLIQAISVQNQNHTSCSLLITHNITLPNPSTFYAINGTLYFQANQKLKKIPRLQRREDFAPPLQAVSGSQLMFQYLQSCQCLMLYQRHLIVDYLDPNSQSSYFIIGYVFEKLKFKEVGISELVAKQNYQNYISLSIASALLAYFYRVGVKVSLSFEGPIAQITALINNNKLKCIRASDQVSLNCKEIEDLYHEIVKLLIYTDIQQSEHKITDQDTGALYMYNLSRAKHFYKTNKNLWFIGVCANNIALCHYQNKRYIEALNEQAESVVICQQEIISLKQLWKIRKQIHNKKIQPSDLLLRLRTYVLNKLTANQRFLSDRRIIVTQQNDRAKLVKQVSQASERLLYDQLRHQMTSKFNTFQSNEQRNIVKTNFEDQLLKYKHEKQQLQLTLFFRRYQFSNMLFKFSQQGNNVVINEAFTSLQELNNDLGYFPHKYRSLLVMRLLVQIKIFKLLVQIHKYDLAEIQLKEVYDQHEQIEMSDYADLQLENGVNIFDGVPFPCLRHRVQMAQIQMMLINKQEYEACKECVVLIRENNPYDKKVEDFAYEKLFQVFAKERLQMEDFWRIYDSEKNVYSYIIMIDYSNVISEEQLRVSHAIGRYIVDQMGFDDELGIYTFNETLFEVCNTHQPKHYRQLIASQFEQYFMPKGGECKPFQNIVRLAECLEEKRNLIQMSQKLIETKVRRSLSENSQIDIKEIQKIQAQLSHHMQRYLCLFTEGSFSSEPEVSLSQVEESLNLLDIKLIVFNIANSKCNSRKLLRMARQCRGKIINDEQQAIRWMRSHRQLAPNKRKYLEFL